MAISVNAIDSVVTTRKVVVQSVQQLEQEEVHAQTPGHALGMQDTPDHAVSEDGGHVGRQEGKLSATQEPTSSGKGKQTTCATESASSSKLNIAPAPSRLRMILPPSNFGAIEPGHIYRSGYPTEQNYDFIASLGIKTILILVPEPISPEYKAFMYQHKINHYQIHIPANKDGVVNITQERMMMALSYVLDRSNHPMLIHCNRGKHRTGCVTACFRKVQSVNVDSALAEYRDYSYPKCRDDDMAFIRSFDANQVLSYARSKGWPVTPPPEPNTEFWHLKKDSMFFTLEDIAALKVPEEADQSL